MTYTPAVNTPDFLKPIRLNHMKRLGPNEDGGYVVYEKILNETDGCLTYGVGNEVRFEEHFNRITGKKVLMFDPTMFGRYMLSPGYCRWLLARFKIIDFFKYLTITRRKWIKKKQLVKKNILFFNEGLSASPNGKYDTLSNHLQRFQLADDQLLLKIDIEGAEYEVFESMDFEVTLRNVNQLLVEFHDVGKSFERFRALIEQLNRYFAIIHVHGNNFGTENQIGGLAGMENSALTIPDSLEITFLRRDQLVDSEIVHDEISYPVEGLDFPNDPLRADLKLEFPVRCG